MFGWGTRRDGGIKLNGFKADRILNFTRTRRDGNAELPRTTKDIIPVTSCIGPDHPVDVIVGDSRNSVSCSSGTPLSSCTML